MTTITRPLLTVLLLSILALPACLAVSDDVDVAAKTHQPAPSLGVAGAEGPSWPQEAPAAPDPNPWLPAWFTQDDTREALTTFLLQTKAWGEPLQTLLDSPKAPPNPTKAWGDPLGTLPNYPKAPPTPPPAELGDRPFC